jgi:hypothetical protein
MPLDLTFLLSIRNLSKLRRLKMAENEILDIGNKHRWKRTRIALCDPSRSLFDVAEIAAMEYEEIVQLALSALRKNDGLRSLMKAANGSSIEQQIVISNFTEKALATLVLSSVKIAGQFDSYAIADELARGMARCIIDQFLLRAGGEPPNVNALERLNLESLLQTKFAPIVANMRTTLEAYIRGKPVKRPPRKLRSRPILNARAVVGISLTSSRSGAPDAR